MSETVIEARGLTKRYGRQVAVNGIDLSIAAGEVVGLLGPNGAGKTTTILMLLGLTEPTSGSVRILGHDPLRDPLAVKQQVAYLPDQVGFYDGMTARENLGYTARLAAIPAEAAAARIAEALRRVRLTEVADRPVRTYSHGMRQRLGLAEALMRDCRIAILDEPTSGLDPQSTRELLDLITEFSRDGMTFLLSSHMLDVVQSICTRVALFRQGRIGFLGTLDELGAELSGGTHVITVTALDSDVPGLITDLAEVTAVHRRGDDTWQIEATRDLRPEIAERIVEHDGKLLSLEAGRMKLDELYNRYFEEVRHAA